MRPDRSEIINGHEVEEYGWHRDMVVYMDAYKWDASYESALAWAKRHNEKWDAAALKLAKEMQK